MKENIGFLMAMIMTGGILIGLNLKFGVVKNVWVRTDGRFGLGAQLLTCLSFLILAGMIVQWALESLGLGVEFAKIASGVLAGVYIVFLQPMNIRKGQVRLTHMK